MKIVFLDAKTIGDDIDLSGFDALGEVSPDTTLPHRKKHLNGSGTQTF